MYLATFKLNLVNYVLLFNQLMSVDLMLPVWSSDINNRLSISVFIFHTQLVLYLYTCTEVCMQQQHLRQIRLLSQSD